MLIAHANLGAVTEAILIAAGSDDNEARIVSDHLVGANLAGHDSHGVGMIPNYMKNLHEGTLRPNRHAEFLRRDGVIGIVDGGRGYGQVIAREAMEWAIGKAREAGVAVTALRNTHHVARVGTYGEQVCAAGLVSLHFVNVNSGPPRVAPFRGATGRMGTNPVCIAVPGTDATPAVVLDFATSKIAIGKVRVAYNEGRQVKEGTLIDGAGRPTTDPSVLFSNPLGAVLPIGEHKGYGLAMMCELLGGALAGSNTVQPENSRDVGITNGMVSIVLNPGHFVDVGWFRHEVDQLVSYLKDTPAADPDAPVLVPGEPERQYRAQRGAAGIPVDDETWREILEAGASVGVAADRLQALARGEGGGSGGSSAG
ncbi:MAG TPA: malate/lactate/ureidoglycolate dehydrogenase [Stellaceae bacterium]